MMNDTHMAMGGRYSEITVFILSCPNRIKKVFVVLINLFF
jgi:hypothetical protein